MWKKTKHRSKKNELARIHMEHAHFENMHMALSGFNNATIKRDLRPTEEKPRRSMKNKFRVVKVVGLAVILFVVAILIISFSVYGGYEILRHTFEDVNKYYFYYPMNIIGCVTMGFLVPKIMDYTLGDILFPGLIKE